MALSVLIKPGSTRALLITHIHHPSPAMGAPRCFNGEISTSVSLMKVGSSSALQLSKQPRSSRASLTCKPMCIRSSLSLMSECDVGQGYACYKLLSVEALGLPGTLRGQFSRHSQNTYSSLKQRRFSTSAGPTNSSGNGSGTTPPNISSTQAPASKGGYPQQQQQPPPPPRYPPPRQPASTLNPGNNYEPQQPSYSPARPNPQQPGYTPASGTNASHMPYNQNLGQPATGGGPPGFTSPAGVPTGSNDAPTGPPGGSPASNNTTNGPRTSAAAEVIGKYLGPSTLKLEKRDDKAAPPPPPPPRRNYGPQGTQEKKSGKDLVAESAACAVIEKYLGPWPGFPPRDPKIDEYLDSLPENAACAAIDKYFGPYKPLFVFKKNENSDNPPPPSRPPRNRMMSRARNRAWNASQQGASVDRPWTAPQSGPGATQGTNAAPPPQGGGAMPPSQGAMPPSQGAGGGPPSHGAASPQGANIPPSSQAPGGMPPPHTGSDIRQ